MVTAWSCASSVSVPDGRVEGKIVQILERRAQTVVGRFDVDPAGLSFVVPFDRRLLTDVSVARGDTARCRAGRHGHRRGHTLADADARPGRSRRRSARRHRRAGRRHRNHPAQARQSPTSTRTRPLQEAVRLGSEVRERDIQGRTDFRDRPIVTIDGEDARDFDDAISIERLPNGHFWLGVHIADVAHYVAEGGALDADAYARGTSVYFPERAVHMFPEALSTGLCSLRPHVDRLVQSCLMEVNATGDVVRYEMHDGVIHSTERMTYTAVNAILTERDPETIERYRPLVPMFEMMRELFDDPERPARAARLGRFRSAGAQDHPGRRRPHRGHRRVRAKRRASTHRRVHAARQRNGRRASRAQRHAGALPHSRAARIRSR